VLDIVDLAVTMPDLSVTIAGDGPLADEIARIAKRVVNLEYLGRLGRERVAELIARSRAVLLPSHWEEPAGLAAVEAMSLGTPVVAYRRGGLAEYVEDADAGPVIAPSTAALVEAVRELLADPQRWHRHSAAGRKAVASRHSVERCIQMYEELYEDQMVSRPGP
jgi:glycosyltransferase involved in cell wall biosynthesis